MITMLKWHLRSFSGGEVKQRRKCSATSVSQQSPGSNNLHLIFAKLICPDPLFDKLTFLKLVIDKKDAIFQTRVRSYCLVPEPCWPSLSWPWRQPLGQNIKKVVESEF